MNLNALEKVARQLLNGKAGNTLNNSQLMSTSWQITPGGAAAGTFAAIRPNGSWA